MPPVLIIHEVEDYPAWKRIFDGAAAMRKEASVKSANWIYFEQSESGIL